MPRLIVLILASSLTLASCASTKNSTIVPHVGDGPTDPDAPPLLSPKIQRIWIPDHISNDGRRYEKGHYAYEIERGTVWTMQ